MKVSVVIPSYNYAQYLSEAINSVISQTYTDWELIIVDDGSSDDSLKIIKEYCEKDSRIKFFAHDDGVNKGLRETILLGLEHVTGDWVAFLESDDFFEHNYFEEKLKIAKKYPQTLLIFNKVNFISTETVTKQKDFELVQERLEKIEFPKKMFRDFYLGNKILTFSCVMIKAEVIKKADFKTPIDVFLDWWLWINLSFLGDFYYVNKPLTNWRLHEKSYISEGKKPKICTLPNLAYQNIYKNNKSIGLCWFMFYSGIQFFLMRLLNFLKKKINL